MRSWFVSDIHIRSMQEERAEKFLLFLRYLNHTNTQNLFLLGDIFDLWVADHEYFQNRYKPIIDEIQRLVSERVSVHYFEGNHDLHLKIFWQDQLGVKVHDGPYFQRIANWYVRMEHGDLTNPYDKGYIFLHKFLRTNALKTISHHLPGFLVHWIGNKASLVSRNYTKDLEFEKSTKEMVREHAQKVAAQEKTDFIITGHTHVRDEFQFSSGLSIVTLINLGSWFEEKQMVFFLEEHHSGWTNIDELTK